MNIFTRVLSYLRLAEQHTVATIMSDFHRVISRLEGHAVASQKKANDLNNQAAAILGQATVAQAEANTATLVAANVAALVTPADPIVTQAGPMTSPVVAS